MRFSFTTRFNSVWLSRSSVFLCFETALQRTVEQLVDAPVTQTEVLSQQRVQESTAEDAPVSHFRE